MSDSVRGPLLPALKRAGAWIALAVLFGISHTQDILYSSNQNTKLLHGLAWAEKGFLAKDWMAQTVDPLPLFSAFIGLTYKYLGPFFFYVYFVALLGIYLYSAMGIFSLHSNLGRSLAFRAAFLTIMVLLYSGFISDAVLRVSGADMLRSGLSGVAQMDLVGTIFSNGAFGVFLVLSILLFLRGRPWLAAIMIAVACTVHPAYLFGGATLTSAYMLLTIKKGGGWKKSLLLGGFTLLLVLPVLLSSGGFLASSSPQVSRRALEIIVLERIPHHSLPSEWFDYTVLLKLVFAALALYLLRGKDLFWILLIPLALTLALTLAQVATGSLRLAMFAPWRTSAFLVPLCELALVAAALSFAGGRAGPALERLKLPLLALCAAIVAFCFLGGLRVQSQKFGGFARSEAAALFAWVEQNKREGEQYLVPPDDDALQRLRLHAGVPVFVSWKTHPYKDSEVLEWYQRVQAARAFYAAKDHAAAEQVAELRRRYGISHVVLKGQDPPLPAGSGSTVYANRAYRVVALSAE